MESKPSLSSEAIKTYRRAARRQAQNRFQTQEKRRQRARQAVSEAIGRVLPRYPTVQRAYLFGSVTRPGAFKPGSDIDVGIEGANMALCFDIWRDVEKAIPEWPLDVRPLDGDDLFAERIRRKGELVYVQSV